MEAGPLPELDLDDYAGVFVGGGPFNSSDPAEDKSAVQQRVERELASLLDEIVARDFPFFGACYGVGTLGVHQGGVIDRTYAEPVSAVRVQLTDEGRADRCSPAWPRSSTRSWATRRPAASCRRTPSCWRARPRARYRCSGSRRTSTPPSSTPNWTSTGSSPASTSTSTRATSRPRNSRH